MGYFLRELAKLLSYFLLKTPVFLSITKYSPCLVSHQQHVALALELHHDRLKPRHQVLNHEVSSRGSNVHNNFKVNNEFYSFMQQILDRSGKCSF